MAYDKPRGRKRRQLREYERRPIPVPKQGPLSQVFGRSAQAGGPRAGLPKAPGLSGGGNLQGKESLKALYMQKKRRR